MTVSARLAAGGRLSRVKGTTFDLRSEGTSLLVGAGTAVRPRPPGVALPVVQPAGRAGLAGATPEHVGATSLADHVSVGLGPGAVGENQAEWSCLVTGLEAHHRMPTPVGS